MRQGFDVQTSRRDVGGDQNLQLVVLEALERPGARRLALVAVDRIGLDAFFLQLLGKAVRAVLGLAEHQHLFPAAGLDEVCKEFPLAVAVDQVHGLRNQLDRRIAARDFDTRGVLEDGAREFAYVIRECGREQQVLALHRKQGDDAADVVDETHVEHAVSLVQHQDFNLRQIDRALLYMVKEAPRRGDDDVHATAQFSNLRVEAHAAEDHC